MSGTAAYYDRLSRWTSVARAAGYGGGRDALTVHRCLADPRSDGRPTPTRLHDILLEALTASAVDPLRAGPRVLDAGCGLGGTMLFLAPRLGGVYTGLTLSEAQARTGRRAIARAGLASSVRIEVGTYDAPAPGGRGREGGTQDGGGTFDLIVAIESLAHSPDPAASLDALIGQLSPGGLLAIVDDMPPSIGALDDMPPSIEKPASIAGSNSALAIFKSGWQCPVLWTAGQYTGHLAARGLSLVTHRDLTDDVRPRDLARIRLLERLNRAAHAALPVAGWRAVLDSYHAGLALERLYRQHQMHYRLLVARR